MGIFHCPFGVAFYDDEGCIDCGMCSAETQEQMVEASRKVRAYLKANAPEPGPVRRVAVAGKGGVGKSSITVLLARALVKAGRMVLVLDTDESNPGLFRMFGFEKTPKPMMSLLRRFSTGQTESDTDWLRREKINLLDIPSEFIIERDCLKFMMTGKIEDPFEGCACSMSDITRGLMGKLALQDKEAVVVDLEAGVESFGRGVERNVDTVLIIVEPSFESMALAERICFMSEGMGIYRVGAILNKVSSEKIRQRMFEELDKKSVRVIGTVYHDSELREAGFEGQAPGETKAGRDVGDIVASLLDNPG